MNKKFETKIQLLNSAGDAISSSSSFEDICHIAIERSINLLESYGAALIIYRKREDFWFLNVGFVQIEAEVQESA